MPFEKGKSGNTKGRPSGTKQSARKIGANKLKKLLRALEPIADESILVAAEIMQDDKATHATKLKAAVELLNKYVQLTGEVYFEQLAKEEEGGKTPNNGDSEDGEESEDSSKGKLTLLSDKK